MYRPGSGTGKQTRYQGIGNRPPDAPQTITDNGIIYRLYSVEFSETIANQKAIQYAKKGVAIIKKHGDEYFIYIPDTGTPDEKEWNERLNTLLIDLIKDEEDAAAKYQRLIDEVDKYPIKLMPNSTKYRNNKQIKDIAAHIKTQENQHRALLDKLNAGTLYFKGHLRRNVW